MSKTQNSDGLFLCAPITNTVANQTNEVLNFVGYTSKIEQHGEEMSIKLFLNNKFVARIVEGCNSISVIILFAAFIIAFASTFKTTLLYVLFGSLLIYFTNIIRIAIIVIAMYEFPKQQKLLHDYLFPALIYGLTLMLWFLWIKKFSKLK